MSFRLFSELLIKEKRDEKSLKGMGKKWRKGRGDEEELEGGEKGGES